MTIKTSKGEYFSAKTVTTANMRGEARALIVLDFGVGMAQAAASFDGLSSFTVTREDAPGVTATYEGYSRIASLNTDADGSVRLILARDE